MQHGWKIWLRWALMLWCAAGWWLAEPACAAQAQAPEEQEERAAATLHVPEDLEDGAAVQVERKLPRWLPWMFTALAVLFWARSRLETAGQRGGWGSGAAVFGLLALMAGGVILAQQAPEEPEEEDDASTTRTRTRNGACEFGAEFGIRVMPPRPTGAEEDVLVNLLRAGLHIDSNGHILLKAKDASAKPYPGTMTFRFFRGPAGQTEFATAISGRVTSDADVQQLLNQPPPRMDAPPGMSPANSRVTELLRFEGTYVPETTTDRCAPPLGEKMAITWRFNNAPISFGCEPVGGPVKSRIKVPKHGSRVVLGDGIIDETTGIPGETNKATHTTVFFAVDGPFACCGQADKPHAIIQFVRHRWQFGNNRPRQDGWNLDGPESQSERHRQMQEYDPTYTTDPAHGAATGGGNNGLTHVGPWDASGQGAVIVEDFPGMLEADHAAFLQQGGFLEWEFLTLLVCKEGHGSAAHYLAHGKVRAKTRFTVRRTYKGGGQAPGVTGTFARGAPEGQQEQYEPCRNLEEALREAGLLNAFNNPRTHRLPLRQ